MPVIVQDRGVFLSVQESGVYFGATHWGFLPITLSHPPQSKRIKQLERKAMFLLHRGIQGVFVGMCMSGVNIFIFIFHRLEGPGLSQLTLSAKLS